MERNSTADILLRVGVAFALAYPALNAFADPATWVGYFPKFMHGVLPEALLLHSFGVLELVLAAWILSGKRIFIPTLIVTVLLLAIVLLNLSQFQVLFRDVTIAVMTLALAIMHKKDRARA